MVLYLYQLDEKGGASFWLLLVGLTVSLGGLLFCWRSVPFWTFLFNALTLLFLNNPRGSFSPLAKVYMKNATNLMIQMVTQQNIIPAGKPNARPMTNGSTYLVVDSVVVVVTLFYFRKNKNLTLHPLSWNYHPSPFKTFIHRQIWWQTMISAKRLLMVISPSVMMTWKR